jgi:hypothetical protein
MSVKLVPLNIRIPTNLKEALKLRCGARSLQDFVRDLVVEAVLEPINTSDPVFQPIINDDRIGGFIDDARGALQTGNIERAVDLLTHASDIIDAAQVTRRVVLGPVFRDEARLKSGPADWNGG